MVKVKLTHATYFGKKNDIVDVSKETLEGYEGLYTDDFEDDTTADDAKGVDDAPNKAVKAEKTSKK